MLCALVAETDYNYTAMKKNGYFIARRKIAGAACGYAYQAFSSMNLTIGGATPPWAE